MAKREKPENPSQERELKWSLSKRDYGRIVRLLPSPREVIEQTNHYLDNGSLDLARGRAMLRLRIAVRRSPRADGGFRIPRSGFPSAAAATEGASAALGPERSPELCEGPSRRAETTTGCKKPRQISSQDEEKNNVRLHREAFLTAKVEKRFRRGCVVADEREIRIPLPSARRIAAGGAAPEGLSPVRAVSALGIGGPFRRVGALRNTRRVHPLAGALVLELDRIRLPDGRVVFEAEVETEDPGTARRRMGEIFRKAGAGPRAGTRTKYERFLGALRSAGKGRLPLRRSAASRPPGTSGGS